MKSNYNGINEIKDIKLNDNLEFEKKQFCNKIVLLTKKILLY